MKDIQNQAGTLLHKEGIQSTKIERWVMKLKDKAVLCQVDKRKQDICICCPAVWQQEITNWFQKQDVLTYQDFEDKEESELEKKENQPEPLLENKSGGRSAGRLHEIEFKINSASTLWMI